MQTFVARHPILASLVASLVVAACGGVERSSGEAPSKATPGATCETSRPPLPAIDGCNPCTCSGPGVWECAQENCPTNSGTGGEPSTSFCTPGTERPAGDGCNTCTCASQGTWQCTRSVCSVCVEGSSKLAPDGCNTCSCQGGGWACTERACSVPIYDGDGGTAPWPQIDSGPPPQCQTGSTMKSDCNTCSCVDGFWECTLINCDACGGPGKPSCASTDAGSPKGCGGWLGNTCSATEYCAYELGQLCGGEDGSGTCKPRPQGCTTDYVPVCGCDRKTYGNACAAAVAGTGVNASGVCPAT